MQRGVTRATGTAALAAPAPAAHGATPAARTAGTHASQDLATAGTGSPCSPVPVLTRTTTKGTLLADHDARPTLGDLPGDTGVAPRRSTDGFATRQARRVVRKDAAPKG